MRVKVLRQEGPDAESRWESFLYDGPMDNTIAGVLDYINNNLEESRPAAPDGIPDDIVDENGKNTTRITWESSCLQGVCGACAMVINGRPALACETFLRDLKGREITLRPLSKFPVIRDLMVDRSSIEENLREMNVYIEEYHPADEKPVSFPRETSSPAAPDLTSRSAKLKPAAPVGLPQEYTVSKCLKCGLCLEVCPNYRKDKRFFGALYAGDCYLVATRNIRKSDEIRDAYRKRFGGSCSKSMACMRVCPMEIDMVASMAKLNRRKR